MFSTIFAKTLFDQRKSILFWGLGIFGMVFMYASLYPSFAGNQELAQALQSMPEAFQKLIGDLEDYSSPTGFIGAEWFALTYPLLLSIFGLILGSGLLPKEEDSRTLELLLARPVSRARILRHKTAAMLAVIASFGFATWLAVAVGTISVDKFEVNLINAGQTVILGVLLGSCFALLALMITAIRNARGLSAGIASLVFAVSYIASTVAADVDWMAPIRKISLFELYKPADALRNGWEPRHALIMLAVCLVLYIVAEIWFRRRDTGR